VLMSSVGDAGAASRSDHAGPADASGAPEEQHVVPRTLEERKMELNKLFGFIKWKSHVTERPLEERSEVVRALYQEPSTLQPMVEANMLLSAGNIFYVVLIGWWLSAVYAMAGALLTVTVVGLPYASICWTLAGFFLWPFGKFLQLVHDGPEGSHSASINLDDLRRRQRSATAATAISAGGASRYGTMVANTLISGPQDEEATSLLESGDGDGRYGKRSSTARSVAVMAAQERLLASSFEDGGVSAMLGKVAWFTFGAPLVIVGHLLAFMLSWMSVVMIPVAKVNVIAARVVASSPLGLVVGGMGMRPLPGADVVLCTYQAANLYYYKYTVFGLNVILFNFLPFVGLCLVFGYVPGMKSDNEVLMFLLSLISIIPVAQLLGTAISTLAVQSNFAIGALLNASFGSVVELILSYQAIRGQFYDLVKAQLTGSLLGSMLLTPGICMVIGGLKHKEQKYNAASASVSSLLLFLAVAGSFAPSVFYKVYGSHELVCRDCTAAEVSLCNVGSCNASMSQSLGVSWSLPRVRHGTSTGNLTAEYFRCEQCHYLQDSVDDDPIYQNSVKPLTRACAVLLPIAYIIGLIFTLKTHAYIFDAPVEEDEEGTAEHGKAVWSKPVCVAVLGICCVLMALVSELLVDNLDGVLADTGISEEFVGLTIIAIIPSIAEIINGVQFALQNSISLSIEVGCSTAVQLCLLQIPIIIYISDILEAQGSGSVFPMIFPDTHIVSVVFAVLVMNYVFQDGKCNYFQGSAMCMIYLIIMVAFYFAPRRDLTSPA
jgi:Ca2+:H+ antiporter